MTQKILDTCCCITFFDDIVSFDMCQIFCNYEIPTSNKVIYELKKEIPSIIKENIIDLDVIDSDKIYLKLKKIFPGLGSGEIASFVMASYLNEINDDQIILITDDKKALVKFDGIRKQDEFLKRFPKIKEITIIKPVDFITYLFKTNRIDKNTLKNIIEDLKPTKISNIYALEKLLKQTI
jgi:hypothetical protein